MAGLGVHLFGMAHTGPHGWDGGGEVESPRAQRDLRRLRRRQNNSSAPSHEVGAFQDCSLRPKSESKTRFLGGQFLAR